jgi:ribonuclease HI
MAVAHELVLQVDGTPGPTPRSPAGVGVVVRDLGGRVLAWRSEQTQARTSQEAEYQAVIAGLELVLRAYPGAHIRCLTDCRIVADQMNGTARVRRITLLPLHAQASALAKQVGVVRFVAIPREQNRLADALAWEARAGRRLFAGR